MSTGHFPDPKDRDRGASTTAIETRETVSEKPDRPSMLQMSVSALTAVSATALLSFVGVWGTVFGMGLLSVLTVLGNYMYSSFIHRTAEKVKQARPVVPRPRNTYPGAETRVHDDGTRVDLEPVTAERANLTEAETAESTGDESEGDPPAGRLRTAWRSMVERYGTRRIVLSIVAVFVVLAGTVTVVEMVAGKPLSGIVRNDTGDGTSMFGGSTSGGSGADDSGESNDPDGESDQQNPQDGDTSDEEPPAEEPQQDQSPAEEPQQDEPPADEPNFEEPPDEEQPADDPPAEEPAPDDEPQQDEPPADDPPAEEPAPDDGGTQ